MRCTAKNQTRYENVSDDRIFDTSVCHARFRKVRVDPHRKRDFDDRRKLGFESNRRIKARMKGVVFRQGYAVGFREVILDNIDEVMDKKDWPEVGKSRIPDTFAKEKVRGWEGRWGKDQSFQEKWNLPKKRAAPQKKRPVVEVIEEDVGAIASDLSKPSSSAPATDVNEFLEGASDAESRKAAAQDAAEYMKNTARVEAAKRYSQYEPQIKPAIERVEHYIEAAPESVKTRVREYREHIDEAIMKPTAASKKKAFALNEYALTLMEMKKYDLAMTYFEKAITLDPSEEIYQTNKARCIDWINYRNKQGGS